MIKSIIVTNHLGDSIELELTRPEKSGFIVQSIDGLGPAKANINTSEIATNDGSIYNSARLNDRDIKFKFLFMEGKTESIEDIRQKSYKYFPVKKQIAIEVKTDNRSTVIYGYVESNEPKIFSKQEGCNIIVMCPDPFFYELNEHSDILNGVEAKFEFPFENNSLTSNLLEFGTIQREPIQHVNYSGDANVGVRFVIHAIGDAKMIKIYNVNTREQMSIDTDKLTALTGKNISASDTIYINTVKGQKSVRLLREGLMYNILNCINKDADWFTLSKGINDFAFSAESGSENLQFSIVNDILYDGV